MNEVCGPLAGGEVGGDWGGAAAPAQHQEDDERVLLSRPHWLSGVKYDYKGEYY